MGDALDLLLSWLPALAAAVVCVIPAGYFVLLLFLWPVEDLPVDGWNLEIVGKGFPITAPILAAILVGPDGDVLDVIVAVAGVTVGLLVFTVSWEPFLRLGGGRSMVRATAGTLAAMACSVAVMGVLARWLPAMLDPLLAALLVAIPVTVMVALYAIDDWRTSREAAAVHAAPGPSVPEGTYPVEWINLDNGEGYGVEMSDLTISLSPRHWRVEWRGSRWRSQPCRCQVRTAIDHPAFGNKLSVVHGPGRYEPGPEGSEIGGIVRGTMGHLLDWRDKQITVVPTEAASEGGSSGGTSASNRRAVD